MATKKKTATRTTTKAKSAADIVKKTPAKEDEADKRTKSKKDNRCTFAIRLPIQDRQAIHNAAGPRGASQFAREVLVAAARGDLAAIKKAMSAAD